MLLTIDTNLKYAESISDIAFHLGIISQAMTPVKATAEILPLYRAVIISHPESVPDIHALIAVLKDKLCGASIYAITDDQAFSPLFKRLYPTASNCTDIIASIINLSAEHGTDPIGTYILSGIDASAYRGNITMHGEELPFTRTELMLLRYLIATYPIPQTPKDILKYSFKPRRQPESTVIRTHISVMNKKFRSIKGRNLIHSVYERGYVISTPELLFELRNAE